MTHHPQFPVRQQQNMHRMNSEES